MSDAATEILLRLSPEAQHAVEKIKELSGFNTRKAIAQAIGDELFIQRVKRSGWTIMLRKGDEYREVLWPEPL